MLQRIMRHSRLVVILAMAGVLAVESARAAETLLIEGFEKKFDISKIKTQDAKIALVKEAKSTALRIDLGHKNAWPGCARPRRRPARAFLTNLCA